MDFEKQKETECFCGYNGVQGNQKNDNNELSR